MSSKQNILVVDDEATNLLLVKAVFKKLEGDFDVLTAKNGTEALSLIYSNDIALAILDIQMPGMSGYELAQEMQKHEHSKNIPIIFLTAIFNEQENIHLGYASGAVDFLSKPFNKFILTQKAKVFLNLDRITKKLEVEIEKRKQIEEDLRIANQRLSELATTDGLTGLHNKRSFLDHLEGELNRAKRNSSFLSLLFIDIDHFKPFNDQFGHQAGDEALKEVADILTQSSREMDIVCRYGGEEFVIILPNTNDHLSKHVAERVRASIEKHDWKERDITCSFGIATTSSSSIPSGILIEQADQALYHSKENGRNKVSHFFEINV